MPSRKEWAAQVLGIPVTATEQEARRAYRILVATWHPDRYADNPELRRQAEERMKEINLAMDVFLDRDVYTFIPGVEEVWSGGYDAAYEDVWGGSYGRPPESDYATTTPTVVSALIDAVFRIVEFGLSYVTGIIAGIVVLPIWCILYLALLMPLLVALAASGALLRLQP